MLLLMIEFQAQTDHEHDHEHEQEDERSFPFRLASPAKCRLVCLRVMGACLSKCIAILAGLSLILICSCEKHPVGEMPEVQKEHVDLNKPVEEGAPAAGASKVSP